MINPAQYNQVLQKASDDQLMQMLRRPDKIPSQFIVSEINRRQHMRQAAQAQQRQQAEQMAQPQQMQPVGMNTGGNPIMAQIDALADRGDIQSLRALTTDPMVVRSYGLPVRKYAQEKLASLVGPQTPSIFQKAVNNVKDTEKVLSPADVNANIMEERREENRLAELANMPTSSMDSQTPKTSAQDRGLSVNDLTQMGTISDLNRPTSSVRTDASQSPAQGSGLSVNDSTQFGANSDLNMSGMNQIASKYLANAPTTSSGLTAAQKTEAQRAFIPSEEMYEGIEYNMNSMNSMPMSPTKKTAQDMVASAQQFSGRGKTGSKSMNMVDDAVRSGILSQAPDKPSPTSAKINSKASATAPLYWLFPKRSNADSAQGRPFKKQDDVSNVGTSMQGRPSGIIDVAPSVGNNQNTTQTSTAQSSPSSNTQGSQSNAQSSEPNISVKGLSALSSNTEEPANAGQTTTDDSFNDKANAIITEALNIGKTDIEATDTKENAGGGLNNAKQGKTSLEIFEGTVKENQELRKAIQSSIDTFSGDQKDKIKKLEAQAEKIFTAEEALAKAYESNTDKPENRIWKSLITAGLDLATTNEANFFQALGNAGKQGIATFDALNQEAKDNVIKKYESAVNLERSKMDVMSQIQNMQNEVTKTQIASQTALAESQMAENLAEGQALKDDREYKLQQDQLALESSLGKEARRLQALGIELDGYRLIADNSNAQDNNRIKELIANKPPAEVAVINHIVSNKDKYGLSDSDVKSLVMGNNTSDTKTPWSQIIPSATTQAESAIMNQPPIPNVDPQGKNNEYTMSQYVNYYTQLMVAQFSGTTPSMVNTSGTNTQPANTRAYSATTGLATKQ